MDRAGALRAALAARGGPRLPAVEWPESLVSTNDRLKALARGGAPEWTAVLADAQTGGRGREGRTWASPPGGLYLSVLLRPRIAKVGLLPLAAGVAVAEAAAELGVATELKWPNDVLASGRKLAGILAEAASGPAGVEWVVLGLGVNVALEASSVPPEIAGAVTSLAAEGGSPGRSRRWRRRSSRAWASATMRCGRARAPSCLRGARAPRPGGAASWTCAPQTANCRGGCATWTRRGRW